MDPPPPPPRRSRNSLPCLHPLTQCLRFFGSCGQVPHVSPELPPPPLRGPLHAKCQAPPEPSIVPMPTASWSGNPHRTASYRWSATYVVLYGETSIVMCEDIAQQPLPSSNTLFIRHSPWETGTCMQPDSWLCTPTGRRQHHCTWDGFHHHVDAPRGVLITLTGLVCCAAGVALPPQGTTPW